MQEGRSGSERMNVHNRQNLEEVVLGKVLVRVVGVKLTETSVN